MSQSLKFYLAAVITLVTACITFSYKYWQPELLFWDENYHVASAYKYMNEVFFLELHPPLGKLILFFSENFFNLNSSLNTENFLSTEHIKEIPKKFSFKALRLPGVFFGVLTTFNLFVIFSKITKSAYASLALSLLFCLDNALLVHTRSAMLESPQLFFSSLLILVYLKLRKNFTWPVWFLFSIIFGLALSVKLNSAILLLLALFIKEKSTIKTLQRMLIFSLTSLSILSFSYYMHFNLSKKIVKNKTYGISAQLKQNIKQKNYSLSTFSLFLLENYQHIKRHQAGVPKLKPDHIEENGSHPVFWPLGKKSISYRWDKTTDGKVKHLKLQINPVGWLISLSAIALATVIVFSSYVFSIELFTEPEDKNIFNLMKVLVFSYFAYMFTMISLSRVMYLYHYFIPLIFGFILAACIFKLFIKLDKKSICAISILLLAQIISFYHFSPFTYHLPVSSTEFNNMSWFSIWRNEQIFWQ